MNRFASGIQRNYYGKGDVIAYRLNRETNTFFGANVLLLIYGDAFWPTYTTGDNTNLVATDSMKNFVQRETLNFPGADLESYARFLAEKFLATYPQAEGVQITATEIPYVTHPSAHDVFIPAGPERATVRLEIDRHRTIEIRSGLQGFKLLRLGGSAFYGFVRDQYTTLPDLRDRPLHMWLELDWSYIHTEAACNQGAVTTSVRNLIYEVFAGFESGSIQQIIYQIGNTMLESLPAIQEIHLEANNRTWDAVTRQSSLGVYTDARPPYGCLGLTLHR